MPSLYLTSLYIIWFKGPADKGLDIVNIIFPIGGNDNFFLLVKGKVVKWAESKSFSCGIYLIKPPPARSCAKGWQGIYFK